MPATSGSVTQIETSTATAAELAGTPDDQLKDGDLACVTALWPNATFRLRRTAFGAAPAPDNVSIISTYSGNGYWEVFGAGGNVLVFANVAALAAYNDTALLDGAVVYVQSIRSYWSKLVGANPGVVDNITNVRNPSNTATWLRDELRSPSWQTQTAWVIDSVNGNDQNSGATGLLPLATWAEFRRRVSVLAVSMTVDILGTNVDSILGDFFAKVKGLSLTINGNPTVVVDGGAVTTFTDPVKTLGACAQGTMTSAAIPDFTAYVGLFVLATGGYVAPILGVSGGGAPYLPFWARTTFSNAKPANNTHIDIISLPQSPTIQLSTHDGLVVNVNYLKFTSTAFADATSIFSTNTVSGPIFFACDFGGFVNNQLDLYALACQLSGTSNLFNYESLSFIGGGSRRTIFLATGGQVTFQGFLIQGGAGLTVGNTSNYSKPTAVGLAGDGLGVFNSSTTGVTLGVNAVISGSYLYGTSASAGYGLDMNYGARVQVSVAPTITGATGNLRFCGAATAIPPLTGGAVVPAASALATWGDFTAAPFNGHVVNYANGSVLSLN